MIVSFTDNYPNTQGKKTSTDLQTEVARLELFQAIARSGEKTEDSVKFQAEAFYKNY